MGVYNVYLTRNTSENMHLMRHKGIGLRGYESICAKYCHFSMMQWHYKSPTESHIFNSINVVKFIKILRKSGEDISEKYIHRLHNRNIMDPNIMK